MLTKRLYTPVETKVKRENNIPSLSLRPLVQSSMTDGICFGSKRRWWKALLDEPLAEKRQPQLCLMGNAASGYLVDLYRQLLNIPEATRPWALGTATGTGCVSKAMPSFFSLGSTLGATAPGM